MLYNLFLVAVTFKLSHNIHMDSFGNVSFLPPRLGHLLLIVPSLVLAIVFF